jgi:TolB-like protein/Flp pilus assembly protein TadD
MNLLAELKRRKIAQWTLGYAAGAWALLQAIGFMVESYDWSHTVSRIAIVVVAVGFFVTLVLAWFHGERGAQRLSRNEMLLLALLLALGGGLAWRTAHAPASTASNVRDAQPANATATNPHSIAVLPFVNMSGDKDNAYFSDGISEEILNVLAQIPGLQVAARTSSFAFKGGNKEVPEIASELKVRMVLEGSVRKQGERVRITAQLIDASNGYHVWSQTYDRDLKDIFAIQDEIAKAIADELKVKIGGATASIAPSKGTRNIQAHDAYLRGLALWQMRGEDNLWQALKQFQQSAAADPQFAEAYAGQALVYVILPDNSARITYDDAFAWARDNAEHALSLEPALPEPYVALGYLADGDRRRETAAALYRRAIALRPSYATAYQWLGNSLWSGGQLEPGVAALERASALDPRSAIIANNHGMALIALGRYADAKALCEPILKSAPDNHSCLESTGFAALDLGDFSEARTLFARYAAVTNPGAEAQVGLVFDALQGNGDRHAIAARLASFMPQSSNDPKSNNAFQPYVITSLLVHLGEPQLALSNLQLWAYTDRAGMSEWAIMQLALGPLHCDPGFVALVKKIKTTDPHYATLCAGKL